MIFLMIVVLNVGIPVAFGKVETVGLDHSVFDPLMKFGMDLTGEIGDSNQGRALRSL
jgi:hypothetical protein